MPTGSRSGMVATGPGPLNFSLISAGSARPCGPSVPQRDWLVGRPVAGLRHLTLTSAGRTELAGRPPFLGQLQVLAAHAPAAVLGGD